MVAHGAPLKRAGKAAKSASKTTKSVPTAAWGKIPPLIFATGGACTQFPPNTLEAFKAALSCGASLHVPVVFLKDGTPIINNGIDLSKTTNAAVDFGDRQTTMEWDPGTVGGGTLRGIFSTQFNLKDYKKLKAKQCVPSRDALQNSIHSVLTLNELLDWVSKQRKMIKKKQKQDPQFPPLRLILELQHPAALNEFLENHLIVENSIAKLLQKHEMVGDENTIIMSHEPLSLIAISSIELNGLKITNPKVQLVHPTLNVHLLKYLNSKYPLSGGSQSWTLEDFLTPNGFDIVKTYAQILGVNKRLILPEPLGPVAEWVKRARELKIPLYVGIFRPEMSVDSVNSGSYLHRAYQYNLLYEINDYLRDHLWLAQALFIEKPEVWQEFLSQNNVSKQMIKSVR